MINCAYGTRPTKDNGYLSCIDHEVRSMSYKGGCYIYTTHKHPMASGRLVTFIEGMRGGDAYNSRGHAIYCNEIDSVISSEDGECRKAVRTGTGTLLG